MRCYPILIMASILLMIASCKKDQTTAEKPSAQMDMINQAHTYFTGEEDRLHLDTNANPRLGGPYFWSVRNWSF